MPVVSPRLPAEGTTVDGEVRWALRTLGLQLPVQLSLQTNGKSFLEGQSEWHTLGCTERHRGHGTGVPEDGTEGGGSRHADREFSKTNERQQVTGSCKMWWSNIYFYLLQSFFSFFWSSTPHSPFSPTLHYRHTGVLTFSVLCSALSRRAGDRGAFAEIGLCYRGLCPSLSNSLWKSHQATLCFSLLHLLAALYSVRRARWLIQQSLLISVLCTSSFFLLKYVSLQAKDFTLWQVFRGGFPGQCSSNFHRCHHVVSFFPSNL